jgi:sodium transport system ATP-binding protein
MIQVNSLHKSFGAVQALRGVSFTSPDGRITGLLGPNGAGKTTTLRILYTLLKPDSGSASIDGYDTVSQSMDVQAHIGVLPESHGLYPRLTARENIRYYGELRGLHGDQLEQKTDQLIDLLDMHEFAERRTDGFSRDSALCCHCPLLVHDPSNVRRRTHQQSDVIAPCVLY